MPDEDFDYINTPVEEKEPRGVTEIRDAIAAIIPSDENLTSDVKIHDGLAEIRVSWRSLRWTACLGTNGATTEYIANKVDNDFRIWLRDSIKNMKDVPKHSRVAAEMRRWLVDNPSKRDWLYGLDDGPTNKSEIAA